MTRLPFVASRHECPLPAPGQSDASGGGSRALRPGGPATTVRLLAGPPVFAAQGLSLSYNGQPALRDISLDIPRGAVTVILGPSGCGKSSLLTALNRLTDLVPGCRLAGGLAFEGADLLAPDVDVVALRRRVGMIFQKPNPFPISIRRNVELPLREHRLCTRGERAGNVRRVLDEVGLWEEVAGRLDASALCLSGGQQQRLCFARALALRPEVLLMDEPTASLDPLAAGVIEDLIGSLKGRYTQVVVTHNLAQARRIADYVAIFWVVDGAGSLIEAGPAAEVFAAPRHPLTRAYLSGSRG